MDAFLVYDALQVIPLIDVCAPNVLDFSGADDALARLMARFGESGDVGMYIRKMSMSGFSISLKPSMPGKNVSKNTAAIA